MIQDRQTVVSIDQAVTASAGSTDSIDLGVALPLGAGETVVPFCRVTEAFATCDSLQVSVQTSDSSTFASGNVTLSTSAVVLTAALLKDSYVPMPPLAANTAKRYVRFYYTVAGTNASAGKVTAGLLAGDNSKPANSVVTA